MHLRLSAVLCQRWVLQCWSLSSVKTSDAILLSWFLLVAYLNLGIMAIAVFAVIAAVIMNINAEQKVSATKG